VEDDLPVPSPYTVQVPKWGQAMLDAWQSGS